MVAGKYKSIGSTILNILNFIFASEVEIKIQPTMKIGTTKINE